MLYAQPAERGAGTCRFKVYREGGAGRAVDGAADPAAARRRRRRRERLRRPSRRRHRRVRPRLRLRPDRAASVPEPGVDPRSGSRRRSSPCGAATPSPTASTRWWRVAGLDWRAGRRAARATRSTCARPARRSAARTSSSASSRTPAIAALLVELFETRHDPDLRGDREVRSDQLVDAHPRATLDAVASLDQDRILRSFLALITRDAAHELVPARRATAPPHPYTAFKLDPRAIPDLPQPRPRFEIWVYSPRVEGVHLRFGASRAAGCAGRTAARTSAPRCSAWSRRRRSRTPSSCRPAPRAASSSRTARPTRPTARPSSPRASTCYRLFIVGAARRHRQPRRRRRRAAGRRRAPRRRRHLPRRRGRQGHGDVLRHRERDLARARLLARRRVRVRRFGRLRPQGDGHHRARRVGVGAAPLPRARRRHRRPQDFTVVGIGDMSGDVFGNGMLLSEHIRLVAAFDHRHVFLDPTPDAAVSFAERRRLFDAAALVVGRLRHRR